MCKKNSRSFLYFIFKEDKHFIAYSPNLDLSTCGRTIEQVKKRFKEVVEIFFEEVEISSKLTALH
ncbi:MAG: hypothetical protein WC998_07245 [Candidatus Paceibacterota bacterium]|jgi:predicted RNase H-like HicB family nuclease